MEMMRKTLRITTAHDYPNRPVRIIVPFVPGAGTDITTRVIARKLSETWGQQVVADNRSGAAGAIGAGEAELRSIKIPVCIVPGNNKIHSRCAGENLSRLMPDCELHILMPQDYDGDMSPNEEWVAKQEELAALFVDFLSRLQSRASALSGRIRLS